MVAIVHSVLYGNEASFVHVLVLILVAVSVLVSASPFECTCEDRSGRQSSRLIMLHLGGIWPTYGERLRATYSTNSLTLVASKSHFEYEHLHNHNRVASASSQSHLFICILASVF